MTDDSPELDDYWLAGMLVLCGIVMVGAVGHGFGVANDIGTGVVEHTVYGTAAVVALGVGAVVVVAVVPLAVGFVVIAAKPRVLAWYAYLRGDET